MAGRLEDTCCLEVSYGEVIEVYVDALKTMDPPLYSERDPVC